MPNTTTAEIQNRKGARKMSEVPEEVIELMNLGKIESINLMEFLHFNHERLVENTFNKLKLSKYITPITTQLKEYENDTVIKKVPLVSKWIFEQVNDKKERIRIINLFKKQTSDMLRCYACFGIEMENAFSLEDKFEMIFDFANDHNAGVREYAWMALRPSVIDQLHSSISILEKWTTHPSDNIRRFASEITRPRGVWCKHINTLKESPHLGLPILNPLNADSSKYVQDSVANWLNDASKTQASFVEEICKKWTKEKPTPQTLRIVKRALRSIHKNKLIK